ncbi:S46 family peptidase [Crocinitomix catalasitica]|uniref:S46 family peptidase n=1 Tax=Crocinitomix catalasitica TaxID=184607 RepID=UPI000486D170|nr:S46 family peptidase [Crocinitomix catalasitica]
MRKLALILIIFIGINTSSKAVEGMWIPSLIDMFHSDMVTYGLKLTPEQIYSTNSTSLKDAVVQFNGGCTAEIVSEKGLLLTNHHCGFSAIQSHSTVEKDYLKNGFWAKNNSEELACPWLRVTFVRGIIDVTDKVHAGIATTASDKDIANAILANIKIMEVEASVDGKLAKIKPFNQGNEYYMLITEDYNDIRLVGTPPSAIGKFGGDTDNWVWPRHTGDFSVFRIYADKDNKSAKYDEANIPFNPDHSLPISLKPVNKGDFTMVYGFPGSTDQHYSAKKLDFYVEQERPARIEMRQKTIDILKPAMRNSDLVRIQYASKQARIANAWKKWIGQIGGLRELDAIEKKKVFEEEFIAKAAEKTEWKKEYYTLIPELSKLQSENEKYEFARVMFIEYFYVGPEFLTYVLDFSKIINAYEQLDSAGVLQEELDRLESKRKSFFKNYNREIDVDIFKALTPIYADAVDASLLPNGFNENWNGMLNDIINKSQLLDSTSVKTILSKMSKGKAKKLGKDPAYAYARIIYNNYFEKTSASYNSFVDKETELMQKYVAGIMEMFPDKKIWADANSTLRIAYGQVDGSQPYDGMEYLHYTTIDGIMQKHATGNPDFELPDRFIQLYNEGDYGQYAQDDELWICFTASNHTTGGNSGSPVIDAEGNLLGINFDRSWESTMSDFMFDESRCRNIVVDIRYVLWVIDKYGEASHLIDEMKFVK